MTDKQQDGELKACPFCGGTDIKMMENAVVYWVQCKNTECYCGMGAERTSAAAVKIWNRRCADQPKEED